MTWVYGRLIQNFFVYLSCSWKGIILSLVISLLFIYFSFESCIWDENFIFEDKDTKGANLINDIKDFINDIKKNNSLLLNLFVSSWTFFTLGYNMYGIMNR